MWVVVVFGYKRHSSDVIGPFVTEGEAEATAVRLMHISGRDAYAFEVKGDVAAYARNDYGVDWATGRVLSDSERWPDSDV